jgi:hypothetical protein
MQYALLVYTKPGAAEALGPDEWEADHRVYLDIRKLPGVVGGAALHPVETATTVRVQDGQTLVTSRRGSRPPGAAARWRSGPSYPRPPSRDPS